MARKNSQAEAAIIGWLLFGVFILIAKLCRYIWSLTPWVRKKQAAIKLAQEQKQKEYEQYLNDLENRWVTQTNPPLVINGKNKWIYVYTTDTERHFNRYKIGETNRNPFNRIKEQDSTSNSGELILVAYWHAGKASDKQIHTLLETSGYVRIRKNREWFIIQDPLTTIPKMLALANA
jgi:hypothetical protein